MRGRLAGGKLGIGNRIGERLLDGWPEDLARVRDELLARMGRKRAGILGDAKRANAARARR